MKPLEGPGWVDVAVVILSPLIVLGLTVIFLLGFWVEAGWVWLRRGR